jgi:hypothetical protein
LRLRILLVLGGRDTSGAFSFVHSGGVVGGDEESLVRFHGMSLVQGPQSCRKSRGPPTDRLNVGIRSRKEPLVQLQRPPQLLRQHGPAPARGLKDRCISDCA